MRLLCDPLALELRAMHHRLPSAVPANSEQRGGNMKFRGVLAYATMTCAAAGCLQRALMVERQLAAVRCAYVVRGHAPDDDANMMVAPTTNKDKRQQVVVVVVEEPLLLPPDTVLRRRRSIIISSLGLFLGFST